MLSEKEFLKGFEECFDQVADTRQRCKVDYPIIEILFWSIVAVAAGACSWEMIEAFGQTILHILREYYSFKNGTPSDDTIRRVFEIIDPSNLNTALSEYFIKNLDLNG